MVIDLKKDIEHSLLSKSKREINIVIGKKKKPYYTISDFNKKKKGCNTCANRNSSFCKNCIYSKLKQDYYEIEKPVWKKHGITYK